MDKCKERIHDRYRDLLGKYIDSPNDYNLIRLLELKKVIRILNGAKSKDIITKNERTAVAEDIKEFQKVY